MYGASWCWVSKREVENTDWITRRPKRLVRSVYADDRKEAPLSSSEHSANDRTYQLSNWLVASDTTTYSVLATKLCLYYAHERHMTDVHISIRVRASHWCKLDIRKYAFSQRTINEWNRLPGECVKGNRHKPDLKIRFWCVYIP